MSRPYKYYLLNKPFGVLTQFSDKDGRPTLGSLFNFPKDVYPIGRLDMDSEGLLLLSNDKQLTEFLLNPKNLHEREYYVQVENIPSKEAIEKLIAGVVIENKKTLPAKVKIIEDPKFPERIPPIRERKTIPTSWVSVTLAEGRNRQVRKMTAAIGHPTLRLIRVRIEKIKLRELKPGEVTELNQQEITRLIKYKH